MKTKICTGCGKRKKLSEFGKNFYHTDGLKSQCKNCTKLARKKFYKKFPWKRTLQNINQRCNNPKSKNYKNYGLKGIKNEFKNLEEDIEFLWFRDKAYNMKRPSIDRKNKNKSYTLNNCQFIELSINSVKDKRKPILQYSLDGKFIKEFESGYEIQRILKISSGNISQCCMAKRQTAGGYKWRYKNV